MPKNRNSTPVNKENWKVVMLAVAGAATFWLFNALNKNYDTRVNYPIEFVFDKDSVVVVSPLPKKVTLDVNGGGWILLRKSLGLNSSAIQIELERPTEIRYFTQATLLPLIAEQLGSLRLNYVVTDTLSIHIEERLVRKVRVAVDSAQVPLEENHRITSAIHISPDTITLSGPRSLMVRVRPTVYTQFEQTDIDDDFDAGVPIDLPGNGLIKARENTVQVRFDVDRFVEHSVEVPVEALNFSSRPTAVLADSVIKVSFLINENRVDQIKPSDFGVVADFAMRNRYDSTIFPTLMYFPDGLHQIKLTPHVISIQYSK